MHRLLSAALLCGISFPTIISARTVVTKTDYPGAAQTYVFAVNNGEQFVGQFIDAAGHGHAFTGQGTTLLPLDPNGPIGTAINSAGLSINNTGQIAGLFRDQANFVHGFVLTSTTVEQIDYPGATTTYAYGVNDNRDIIGVYAGADAVFHAFTRRGGVYANADLAKTGITTPLSINDGGKIAGGYQESSAVVGHGYVERANGKSRMIDDPLAPPDSTYLVSANNRGGLLGGYTDAAGGQNNFILHGDSFKTFTLPAALGATYVSAQTLNDLGDVVGYFVDASGIGHGFLAFRRQ